MNVADLQHVLHFYLTTAYACSYLPGQEARSQVLTPGQLAAHEIYDALIAQGFRRSGEHIYRPRCASCQACLPVRVPVNTFVPNRTQRRCLARNADLQLTPMAPEFVPEHFELYRRYQAERHGGSEMDRDEVEAYSAFLLRSPVTSQLLEWRETVSNGRVLAVALVDQVADGWSAVYTFFDPDAAARSLGTFAVLQEMALARQAGVAYLYLGYWIAASRKMAYKQNYQPLQVFRDGVWMPEAKR